MNVCIDVGNTTTAIGIYQDDKLIHRTSYNTDAKRTEDEYVNLFQNAFENMKVSFGSIERIIFSSVVPSLNRPLMSALKSLIHVEILTISPGIKTNLILKVDNPNEIGNDLIADLVSTKEKYGYPALIIDLGTASKILLLDKNGAFTSCLIMPGLSLSAESLTKKAALLPEVSLEAPKTVLAKNTIHAMNAGIVYGHADMIMGLINRYEKEIGYPCKHILTGGASIYLRDIFDESYIYDRDLNLNGLNILLKKNEVKL
ncbi:MAG: type III pantothenate kinase [Bacilli bacterium]|nr:type III pantothenate kinase [Bacilli bacterium]